MPNPARFVVQHLAVGFAAATVFVSLLVAFDVLGVGSVMMTADPIWLPFALMVFFVGSTFSSIQLGVAIMGLADKSKRQRG